MHSFDRTLLAKLGFSDNDKKDRRHWLACQYLFQDEVSDSVLKMVTEAPLRVRSKMLEVPISKGEGQYRTTIGFVDFAIRLRGEENKWGEAYSPLVCVEVKILPVGVDEIIRQIALYREYQYPNPVFWVAATQFPITSSEISLLKTSQIHHVLLGDKFNRFCEKQLSETAGGIEV